MLDDLILASERYDTDKADYVGFAKEFTWDSEGHIVAPRNLLDLASPPLTMTDNALRQVCSKLGPVVFGKGSQKSLPFEYMRSVPLDLMATCLNRHASAQNGHKWMVRQYKDVARAVVAGDYPGGASGEGFENTVYLKALGELAGKSESAKNGDFHTIRPVVTADDIYVRVSWKTVQDPNNPNEHWGLGAMLGNDEVGRGRGKVYAAVKRGSCDNTFLIDTSEYPGVEIVHKGSLAGVRAKMLEAIGVVLKVDAAIMDDVWAAAEAKIPSIDEVLEGLQLTYGWDDAFKTKVAIGTENVSTVLGVINGITWATGHDTAEEPIDPGYAVDMELVAGSLLFAPAKTFENLAAKARQHRAGVDTL